MSDTVAMGPKTDLTDKVAVITGAATRMGLALAAHAAQKRMRVALADRDQEALAVALERVRQKDGRAIAVHTDVADLAEVRELARRTELEFGPPWLICNSSEMNVELNLRDVIHGVQVFAPNLAERREGHIVNFASADCRGANCPAAYAAAIYAIVGLSESLYREFDSISSQVGVTLVCPARIDANLRIVTDCPNCVSDAERVGRRKALPPETLVEEIFAAVAARRFRVFSDAPAVGEPFESVAENCYATVAHCELGDTRKGRCFCSGTNGVTQLRKFQ